MDPAACLSCLCVRAQNRVEFVFHGCVDTLILPDVADVVAAIASDPPARLVRFPKRIRLGFCFLAFHGVRRDTRVPGRTPACCARRSAASADRYAARARSSEAAAIRSWGDGAPGGAPPSAELTAGPGIMVPRDGVSRSSAEGVIATQEAVAPPIEGPVTSETSLDGAAPPELNLSSGTTTTRKPRGPAVREPKGVPGTAGRPGGVGGGGGAVGVAPRAPTPPGARGGAGGPLYVPK